MTPKKRLLLVALACSLVLVAGCGEREEEGLGGEGGEGGDGMGIGEGGESDMAAWDGTRAGLDAMKTMT